MLMHTVWRLYQTCIQLSFDKFFVKMLSDKHELLHTISVNVVPVAKNVRVLFNELLELICRHCGIPLSCISQVYLLSCLFEHVADILLVCEVAHTLCADYALRPASSYELVKACDVHWTSSYIDVCSDAVFLSLTCLLVVMMVMMAAGTLATMMVLAVFIVLVLMLVMMMMMFTMCVIVIMLVIVIAVVF